MRHKHAVFAILAVTLAASRVAAQDHMHSHAEEPSRLGSVHFPVSCQSSIQNDFDHAVALLHSFGYEAARKAFTDVADRDPSCAMAQWGVAMTLYHPIWAAPTAAEFKQGRAAAQKAAQLGAASPREQGFIAAISAFYSHADQVNHKARAQAYRQAMEDLTHRFPDDHEAAIFYALSLLGSAPANDPNHEQEKQAATVLNALLRLEPQHPGIAHYLIHAFDYPGLANLAQSAARAYAGIAPDSPHAQHMPSHIFTRLGLWQESIASNLTSEATANAGVAKTHPGATSFNALHALDYLEYAYLQRGDDAKAQAVLERAVKATSFDDPSFAAGYSLAAIPARYALERHRWSEAASLVSPSAKLPWDQYPYAVAVTQFARAVGGARSGQAPVAQLALTKLEAIRDQLKTAPPAGPYDWAGQVESMRLAAAGYLAQAQGDHEGALRLLRSAADLQDKVGKHPVTPGEVLPARELLADLLLEMNRPAEARSEYEITLKTAPNRLNSLYGAAHSAKLVGDDKAAREFYTRILDMASGDSDRAEVKEARLALQ